ncbi:MAG: CoA pyrophosphatase [Sandaracinus sp.]|nr:CoA pyrophosphatase [Sandaracinus sp.]
MDLEALRRALAQGPAAERDSERRAAVAAVLREGPEGPEALFIRRGEREGDPWSGHMAFPGGRHEPHDPDLFATALRETREEVGLDLQNARSLGRLDDVETHQRGLVVRPYVFELVDVPPLAVPNAEVAEAMWAPLAPMFRGERDTTFAYEHEGRPYRFPGYDVDGKVVWGLTYRMLQMLFGRLR